jgi:phosphoribosyl 1,2-cyclic phosphodiesterase
VKLTFLGTRGEIEARTRRHRRHTSLLVEYLGWRVMIDCGEDWRGHIDEVNPQAIILTHAHPDHAWGLRDGSPCGVWATAETWEDIDDYPLSDRHTVPTTRSVVLEGIEFRAYTVEHSTRCPAVGYRISAGRANVFYVPDLVYIHDRESAMEGIDIYIGDGATMDRSFVRKRGERLIGHSPVRTQLSWCEKLGVHEAIITHCGLQIVEGDERKLGAKLRKWALERNVHASFAYDGMTRIVR